MLPIKCLQIISNMYEQNLAWNNQQCLICHETQPNSITNHSFHLMSLCFCLIFLSSWRMELVFYSLLTIQKCFMLPKNLFSGYNLISISVLTFIIYSIQTIVFIFIIFTMFQLMCPLVFFNNFLPHSRAFMEFFTKPFI